MLDFSKEKVKTNVELLKILATVGGIMVLIVGNLLMKDNFGEIGRHYLYLTILIVALIICAIICYQLYLSIDKHLNNLKNDRQFHIKPFSLYKGDLIL